VASGGCAPISGWAPRLLLCLLSIVLLLAVLVFSRVCVVACLSVIDPPPPTRQRAGHAADHNAHQVANVRVARVFRTLREAIERL